MHPTTFADVWALAELPWFDLVGDRLVLDPAFGPVVDVHTHLSLTFLAPSRVDHERETARVETYLPERGRGLDLEVYINKNLTARDRRAMEVDLVAGSFLARGPRQTHTAANLVRRMADMRIAHAVIHAIDLAFVSRNSEAYLEAARRHPELVPFGSAHPLDPRAPRRVARLAREGARGMKVHPSTQAIAPDHPLTMRVYDACRREGLPVLWHCGPVGIEPDRVRRFSLVRGYEAPIALFPEVTFFLGHSGALDYPAAIELARRYPNVVMDLSCQGLDGTRAILAEVDPERIVYGSDWPFYHQAPGIAKVLIATEGDEALRRKVLHDNAARLLGLA